MHIPESTWDDWTRNDLLQLHIFDVQVEFVSKVPGTFEEVADVQLEGKEPQQLIIKGNVAKPALEVLSVKDEQPIKCVTFGNTYYGTDRTEHAILYNDGPEVVNFVAIVDEDAIAQELVRVLPDCLWA